MTELQQAIASGQVSAAEIEAHRVAGELRDPMKSYPTQHCKTTGMSCNRGCTSCTVADDKKPQTLREAIDGAPADAKTCDWIESDPWGYMPSTYESDCGEVWSFIDGGPKENNVRFCHGCGCTVSVVPFTDSDDAAIKATS